MNRLLSRGAWLALALVSGIGLAGPADAEMVLLDFEEIPNPPGNTFISGSYTSQGFNISAVAPNGNLSTYFVPDSGDGFFFAGSQALGATTEATITLTNVDMVPFSLNSIDVARYFIFNSGNDPVTLTFTGQKAGGGTVQQMFTVTTPVGTAAFDTFHFTGFTDLTAVAWQQDVGPDGVKHQFDNIAITVVPEPMAALLLLVGVPIAGLSWPVGAGNRGAGTRREGRPAVS